MQSKSAEQKRTGAASNTGQEGQVADPKWTRLVANTERAGLVADPERTTQTAETEWTRLGLPADETGCRPRVDESECKSRMKSDCRPHGLGFCRPHGRVGLPDQCGCRPRVDEPRAGKSSGRVWLQSECHGVTMHLRVFVS